MEVAWKGKFRLESFEVYDGTAWWLAKVVDKGERPGYYKVCMVRCGPLLCRHNRNMEKVCEFCGSSWWGGGWCGRQREVSSGAYKIDESRRRALTDAVNWSISGTVDFTDPCLGRRPPPSTGACFSRRSPDRPPSLFWLVEWPTRLTKVDVFVPIHGQSSMIAAERAA